LLAGLDTGLMGNSVFVYGLSNGGPAGLIYGFIFCWVGYFCVIASMAELASIYPTSGGQYHWTFMLAPPSIAKFLSYLMGWSLVLAWQAIVASASFLTGTIIQGLIVLNYPDYGFQRWHGTLLLYAVIAIAVVFNTLLARFLPQIENAILVLHLGGFFLILIPVVVLASHSDAATVFTSFENQGDFQTQGLSFFVGIISAVFASLGADGAVHMSEEIRNASTVVPQSMMWSICINGALGIGMLIAILFCIGNVENAITTPTGYPFIEIFNQAVGNQKGATAMVALVVVITILATLTCMTAASRTLWAFARDRGVPCSHFLAKVNTPYPSQLSTLSNSPRSIKEPRYP
jgi:choline transport protein